MQHTRMVVFGTFRHFELAPGEYEKDEQQQPDSEPVARRRPLWAPPDLIRKEAAMTDMLDDLRNPAATSLRVSAHAGYRVAASGR